MVTANVVAVIPEEAGFGDGPRRVGESGPVLLNAERPRSVKLGDLDEPASELLLIQTVDHLSSIGCADTSVNHILNIR